VITRNRIKLSEKQVALIWQQAIGTNLISTDKQQINVIYPGRINGDNGPDFRDAVILDRFRLTKGDVEVHVRSSHWYDHGHHTDAAYNDVVLHVVMWDDCSQPTLLESGKPIPLVCLSRALGHQAYLLPWTLPCHRILDRMDRPTLWRILTTAGEERFMYKAMHFRDEILDPAPQKQGIKAAGQVLYREMMRALGYAKNTKPFEDLADRMTLPSIRSRQGLTLKQALLLGTAGLLPSQRRQGKPGNREEVQELERTWQSVDSKAETMKETEWNLSHIYPNNSPVRRIIAQSYLLERYGKEGLLPGILQLVKEAHLQGDHRGLQNCLTVPSDGYWRDHFDFGITSRTRMSALLGNSKAAEIAINVILPFAFSWGQLTDEAKLMENSVNLYRNYPGLAENCVTRHMAMQLCLEEPTDFTACQQQGLIHVFRNYCREGRCHQCRLLGQTGPRESDKLPETSYNIKQS
jgi:hypothetical protein